MPRSLGVLLTLFALAIAAQAQTLDEKGLCDSHPQLCTEKQNNVDYAGNYVGHDEPSLLFYSNKKGSGNTNLYFITLPKDPPTFPNQAGTAGTANFQLRPAFWFGMAMCDSQSSPNFTNVCNPDSDANIFDNPNPHAADYIGHHPGVAFMEMQFYPPGWVLWPAGNSCDAFMWCAALNIDSLSEKVVSTGTQFNNLSCRNNAGDEYVNFAFLTKNGVAQDAADPQNGSSAKFTADPSKAFFMNPGDRLMVTQRDTPAGFTVEIWDLSTGAHGLMTASIANGFAQLQFDPSATSCTSLPYAFHPMYATSSEHTRVTWAAHSTTSLSQMKSATSRIAALPQARTSTFNALPEVEIHRGARTTMITIALVLERRRSILSEDASTSSRAGTLISTARSTGLTGPGPWPTPRQIMRCTPNRRASRAHCLPPRATTWTPFACGTTVGWPSRPICRPSNPLQDAVTSRGSAARIHLSLAVFTPSTQPSGGKAAFGRRAGL
jgi:hypothetical protein